MDEERWRSLHEVKLPLIISASFKELFRIFISALDCTFSIPMSPNCNSDPLDVRTTASWTRRQRRRRSAAKARRRSGSTMQTLNLVRRSRATLLAQNTSGLQLVGMKIIVFTWLDRESEAEEEEVYTGGAELMLPPFTKRPPTVKLFRAIEKTALFLAGQGAQMEILLKAKQSGNPVFDFLSNDSPLHPFYRHIISLVKSGQYKRGKQSSPETFPKAPPPPPAPLIHVPRPAAAAPSSIPFKPSEDCAYSQLVNRLKPTVPAVNPAPPPMSDPSAPYPNVTTYPPPPQPSSNGAIAPIVASYGDTRWGPQVAPPPTLPQNGSTTHLNYPPPPPALPPGPSPSPVTVPPGPIIIPPPDVQPVIDKMARYTGSQLSSL